MTNPKTTKPSKERVGIKQINLKGYIFYPKEGQEDNPFGMWRCDELNLVIGKPALYALYFGKDL